MRTWRGGSRHLLWVIFLITFAATLLVQWPRIRDTYSAEDDFRNYYWMHRLQDREYFENDDLLGDRIREFEIGSWQFIVDGASPGYSLLFSIASQWMPFLQFSKILIFPLTLVTIYFLYRIGDYLRGPRIGLLMALIFLVLDLSSPTSISTVAGLQRSFTFPLLTGLLFYLMLDRYLAAAVVVLISGITYPPVFVLSTVTYGLTLLTTRNEGAWHLRVDWQRSLLLLVAVALTMVILIPTLLETARSEPTEIETIRQRSDAEAYTKVFSPANDGRNILNDPYYREGNGGQLFNNFPFVGRGGLALPGTSVLHLAILGLLAIAVGIAYPDSVIDLPLALKGFFIAIWVCFISAWLVILLTSTFLLYLPSRYTEAGLLLFLFIFVVANGDRAARRVAKSLSSNRITVIALTVPVALIALGLLIRISRQQSRSGLEPSDLLWVLVLLTFLLIILGILSFRQRNVEVPSFDMNPRLRTSLRTTLVLLLVFVSSGYVAAFQPRYYVASPIERELFQFIDTLPKDAVLGGSMPDKRNSVPMFARRSIIKECQNPQIDLRSAAAQAYFAPIEEVHQVVTYCQQCDVDYLVVDEQSFTPDALAAGRDNVAGSYLADFYDSIDDDRFFALENIPAELRLHQSGDFFVVACDDTISAAILDINNEH